MDKVTIGGINIDQLKSRTASASSLLRGGRNSSQDPLSSILVQKQRDTLKFTHLMLKTRVAKDLDTTLANHLEAHPEMKQDAYIAIITDGGFSAEVVDKGIAEAQLSALPLEQHQALGKDPIGYFSRSEFPAKTSDKPEYRDLQAKLNRFFKRNADVLGYLRNNPEANVDPSTLYKTPNR